MGGRNDDASGYFRSPQEESGGRSNSLGSRPTHIPFEYNAPQYFDFSHVEDEEEILSMHQYFHRKFENASAGHPGCEECQIEHSKQLGISAAYTGHNTTADAREAEELEDEAEQDHDLYPKLQGKRLYDELMAVAPKAAKLSVPRSPNLATARRSRAKNAMDQPQWSSDSNASRQATKRHKSESSHYHQPSKGMTMTACSTAPLTIPEEFHFHTEERMRSHLEKNKAEDSHKGVCGTPLLEAVRKFQTKTPARFHTVPHDQNRPMLPEKVEFRLTTPHEPELETATRVRATKVKSSAEIEEEEMAQMPKFKARPFDKHIVDGGGLIGVRKVEPPPPTKPQEFLFLTAERALLHPTSMPIKRKPVTADVYNDEYGMTIVQPFHLETSERGKPSKLKSSAELEEEELAKIPKFKARPLNKKIMHSIGDLGVPRVVARPVTTPEEFHLLTDERGTRHKTAPVLEQPKAVCATSANVTNYRGTTNPAPFHLETEERGKVKVERFISMVEYELKKADMKQLPRARDCFWTHLSPQVPPKPPPKDLTVFEPFEGVEEHHKVYHYHAADRVLAELNEHNVPFRARPFVRRSPPKPLAKSEVRRPEFQEFNMHADKRAVERQEFENHLLEKESLYKLQQEELTKCKQEEEERTVKRQRREMVHKPVPLPSFDNPFVAKPSSKKPTTPISPRLHKRKENLDQEAAEEAARLQLTGW